MGAWRPFFVMATVHDKEKELYREISRSVTQGLPGVEVLAVELTGRERFCVYVDAPGGVDHALCERVSGAAAPLSRALLGRGLLAGDRASAAHARPLRAGARAQRASQDRGGPRLRGEVRAAGERGFTLAGRAGEPVDIPYDAIVRANLIDEG